MEASETTSTKRQDVMDEKLVCLDIQSKWYCC